ncbi:MAG: DUF3147 domain-containing protein [Dehalococcoidia bacterium]
MDVKILPVYFVIGGSVIALAIYLGSHGRSLFAAFIAFFPAVSVITICGIYLASGTQAAVSYTRSMLILLPPWVLYVVAVMLLLPRIGLAWSLVVGIAAYSLVAFLIMRLT